MIVLLQHPVILRYQEARPLGPAQKQQIEILPWRDRTSVPPLDPEATPMRAGAEAWAEREIARQDDLGTPFAPRLPAMGLEEIGNRRQRIRHVGPNVVQTVAILIDAEAQIARGHELDRSHGTRP